VLLHLTKTHFPLMLGVNILPVQYKLCQHIAVQAFCHRHYYPAYVQSYVQLAYLPFTNNVDLRWPCSSVLHPTLYVNFQFTFTVLNIMAILCYLKQATHTPASAPMWHCLPNAWPRGVSRHTTPHKTERIMLTIESCELDLPGSSSNSHNK